MRKRGGFLLGVMVILMCSLIAGCANREERRPREEEEESIGPSEIETLKPVKRPKETALPSPAVTPTPNPHKGEEKSRLTGAWVDKKKAGKRPYAIMLNNIKEANPQWGIKDAAILYEALVEGGITRFMGIYEDFTDERIGSVRSARHYYTSIADEYHAIMVHYGETKYAKKKRLQLKVDNLSGTESIGSMVFYRDKKIKAPHNAFTNGKKISKGATEKGYSRKYKGKASHFYFYEKDTNLKNAKKAFKVTLDFSSYTKPYFIYHKEDKLYYRYQFGKEHKDAKTGRQLAYKNLIIQFVREWNIDKNGYQTMDLEDASGKGIYITNGSAADITWTKKEAGKEMAYYNQSGKVLSINPGNTYIAIFPDNRKVTISEKK